MVTAYKNKPNDISLSEIKDSINSLILKFNASDKEISRCKFISEQANLQIKNITKTIIQDHTLNYFNKKQLIQKHYIYHKESLMELAVEIGLNFKPAYRMV